MDEKVEKMDEGIYLNEKRVTSDELADEMLKKNQRIIQEDATHYRKLERMNG